MGMQHPNPRLAKTHHTYSVEELAGLFGLHPNTIRAWQTAGLEPVDDGRPILFRGDVVRAFLVKRREDAKRPCPPGTIYCLPCRKPRRPAGGLVDFEPASSLAGNLIGMCPACDRLMFRRIRQADLAAFAAVDGISVAERDPSLCPSFNPSVNCDLASEERPR